MTVTALRRPPPPHASHSASHVGYGGELDQAIARAERLGQLLQAVRDRPDLDLDDTMLNSLAAMLAAIARDMRRAAVSSSTWRP